METETVTPINDATRALRATSTEGLLDALVQLTHRVHDADETNPGCGAPALARRERLAELRAQRDMVRAELLRRAGA